MDHLVLNLVYKCEIQSISHYSWPMLIFLPVVMTGIAVQVESISPEQREAIKKVLSVVTVLSKLYISV